MKKISILTPCYNEEDNVNAVYEQTKAVFKTLPSYSYEHIFIDNASTDNTVNKLKEIAEQDKNVKIIVNAKNFGHIRSPFYGLLQCHGDAVILLLSDLQDPPQLMKDFILKWEQGFKIVVGIKENSKGFNLLKLIKNIYYKIISKISNTEMIQNFTGFGLYDSSIIESLRKINDPYPYFRGLILELTNSIIKIPYQQPARLKGKSKSNIYTLFDLAMLGLTNYSKIPLHLITLAGFTLSIISFVISMGFLLLKLILWKTFTLGFAPLLIGLFFFASIQLFFLGILGEYLGAVLTQVKNRPLVIEHERINF